MRHILTILFLLSLVACSKRKVNRTDEWHLIQTDSTHKSEINGVSKTDSSANHEESNTIYHTTDTALNEEMEIVMQRQKDYANGDTSAHFPPRPYTPVIIQREGDKVTIDAGGRDIQTIRLKQRKEGSKKDSIVAKVVNAVAISTYDSTNTRDTTHSVSSNAGETQNKNVETSRVPVWLYIAGGFVVLIVIIAIIYKKKTSIVRRVVDELPEI